MYYYLMDNIVDKELYQKIKNYVSSKYKHSIYRSMLIQKIYKEAGGKYRKEKGKKLNRWLKEKWIVMEPYILNGDIFQCGDKKFVDKSACRPLYVIDKKLTPITADEVIEKHGIDRVIEAIRIKNSDPQRFRLNWHTLKITSKY